MVIDNTFRLCAIQVPLFFFRSVGTNRAEVSWTCNITAVDGIVLA